MSNVIKFRRGKRIPFHRQETTSGKVFLSGVAITWVVIAARVSSTFAN